MESECQVMDQPLTPAEVERMRSEYAAGCGDPRVMRLLDQLARSESDRLRLLGRLEEMEARLTRRILPDDWRGRRSVLRA